MKTASLADATTAISSGRPVVIMVSAPWCGPCQGMDAMLTSIANRNAHVEFMKVDADAEPEARTVLFFRTIPTVLGFSGGHEVSRQAGAFTEAKAASILSPVLTEKA